MGKRGPKPRAGAPARGRAEIRMTMDELRALRALARRHGHSMADLLRLGAFEVAEQAGDRAPLGLGPALVRRIVAAHVTEVRRQVAALADRENASGRVSDAPADSVQSRHEARRASDWSAHS